MINIKQAAMVGLLLLGVQAQAQTYSVPAATVPLLIGTNIPTEAPPRGTYVNTPIPVCPGTPSPSQMYIGSGYTNAPFYMWLNAAAAAKTVSVQTTPGSGCSLRVITY